MNSSRAMLAPFFLILCGACRSDEVTVPDATVAGARAGFARAVVEVECGTLHRVDTRWDVTTTIVKADGESCSSYVNVPPDSTASEIASSIASAIEAVCDIEAEVLPGLDLRREIELKGAVFGEIRLCKYGTELKPGPGGDPRVFHENPVPIDGTLTITRVP